MEQHLRTGFGPAHMLFLFHPPVYQLVHSRLHPRCRYATAFATFPAVVDALPYRVDPASGSGMGSSPHQGCDSPARRGAYRPFRATGPMRAVPG